MLWLEDKTKLFWSVKLETVTVPETPDPVTVSPTAIFLFVDWPSTTKAVALLIAPFTTAVDEAKDKGYSFIVVLLCLVK